MAKFDHVKNQLYKFRTDNENLSKDQVDHYAWLFKSEYLSMAPANRERRII